MYSEKFESKTQMTCVTKSRCLSHTAKVNKKVMFEKSSHPIAWSPLAPYVVLS